MNIFVAPVFFLLLGCGSRVVLSKVSSRKPHILLILADDFGWGNLGAHRKDTDTEAARQAQKEAYTPNLDSLISEGVLLERHYSYRICSPARSSLQSGRLAVHVNTVNPSPFIHNASDPVSGYAGIPRNMTGMAQKLQEAGYHTAMVGKWDVGAATPRHTPQGRGYQEWFGYYQHANNYWTKGGDIKATGEVDNCLNKFTDLSELNATYRGGVLDPSALDATCENSTAADPYCYEEAIFRRQALNVIENHDPSERPLFFHHAFHLVHTPLDIPLAYLQAADERIRPYSFDDDGRRRYSAMVHYLDDVVGELVSAFKRKGMWQDTLLVFLSDNGGPLYRPGSANNHPLKGGKYSDWEGGIRTNAFIAGGILPFSRRGTAYTGVVSVADWYGVFCDLANVSTADAEAAETNAWLQEQGLPLLAPVDSVPGLWDAIVSGKQENRRPILHLSAESVLAWPYKLITGVQPYSSWTGELFPNCSNGTQHSPWFMDTKLFNQRLPDAHSEERWLQDCAHGCLFNVEDDPTEHNDLSGSHPQRLEALQTLLSQLNRSNFNPGRGSMSRQSCMKALEVGGYYGPFLDTEGWYTGPFPSINRVQQLKDALLFALFNVKWVQDALVNITAEFLLPLVQVRYENRLDHCLANSTTTLGAERNSGGEVHRALVLAVPPLAAESALWVSLLFFALIFATLLFHKTKAKVRYAVTCLA
ncbi:hypothetical protein CYMTET_39964 [Cymbomonas tetramitiformis]|uniref:Sulfatase N-terminal domain-containing protein n=1 Tax=Cymbomonas tetramitiformis TaxID=36881 RepID=A0AAE0C900_9CHLO|nr:hypothetical protein CYMTET_39964 [Cymbomonas tetramitiformis]